MAVRSTFDLNDRPAREALQRMRREGEQTKAVFIDLGHAVDDTFNDANLAEAKAYQEVLSGVERQGRQTFDSLSRNANEAERSVNSSLHSMDREAELLSNRLNRLGRTRSTPQVNLDGVADAIAQVELLERKLSSLGRQTARPNVNLPVTRLAAAEAASGGGGGGGGGFSLPFGGSSLALAAGALGAAPPLLGGATALLGSLGGATLGAGALGITGAGVLGVGGALTLPTTISTISGIKEASKALKAYQTEVLKSGPNSKAAAEKLRYYNSVLETAPRGTEDLLRARTELKREFMGATRPGQGDITGIATRGINLGRQLTPLGSRLSNRFLGEGQAQFGNFAGFLNEGRSRDFYKAMSAEATADLSFVEQTSENVLATMENIARAGRPFFHEGVVFLEHWTEGWRRSTNDLHGTRQAIGGMVDDLKAWGHLGGAGFRLIRDLMEPAAAPGTSMVDDLTHQLEEWDRWVQRNPRQISEFFENSAEGTEKIAGALGRITKLLWKLGQQLSPLIEQGSHMVELLGNAGLLTPGGLPLFLAAGRGVQGLFGGRGGVGGVGGGSMAAPAGAAAPLLFGGGSGRWGTSYGSARYGAALEGLPITSRTPRPGFLSRVAAGARVPVAASTVPGGLTMGMEAEQGLIGATRFSPAAYARALGSESLSAAAGPASTFARGFAGSFGPYMALSFGLGALGTKGDIGERLQGGLSQATLGLIAPPPTSDQRVEEGFRHALAQFKGQREDPNFLRKQWEGKPHFTRFGPAYAPGTDLKPALRHRKVPALNLAVKGLREADITTPEGAGEASYYRKLIEQIKSGQEERAQASLIDIHQGFAIRRAHGASPEEAFKKAAAGIEARASELHGRTSREFTQMSLDWAQALGRSNPKIKGLVDELAERTEKRLHRMGEQVEIINGKIVDVSAQSWGKVSELIGTETQLALSEANKNLTALEKRAFSILEKMGYSHAQAQSITHEAQTGRPTKAGSEANATAHHHGQPSATINNMSPGGGRHHATGGRLAVPRSGSLHDLLHLGGGNYAAGGELMIDGREIANRHTERKLDRLLAPYGTSLAREIANEGRAHSEPFRAFSATGGRGRAQPGWRGISPAGLHEGIRRVAGVVLGQFPGLQVTSTTGGSHVSGSLHYIGDAVDVSGASQTMYDASQWIKQTGLFRQLNEGIHNPNLAVNEGKIESGPGVYGAVWAGHRDHIHLGVTKAVGQIALGTAGRLAGAGGLGGPRQIHLPAPQSRRRGIPGAAVNRAGAMEAGGLERNINNILARRGGGGGIHGPFPASGGSRRAVEAQIAQELGRHGANRIAAAGIIGNAYAESSMDPGAEGTGGGGLWGFTSGAISLANLKKAGGGNWESPRFQTDFMLGHGGQGLIPALNKAGSPEAAARLFMEQWERPGIPRLDVRESGARTAFGQGFSRGGRLPGFAGWFRQGGHFRVKNPTLFGVGEGGEPEDISVTPLRKRGGGGTTGPISVTVKTGPIHVGSAAEAKEVGQKLAEGIAEHLADKLESSDRVPERMLTG